MSPCYCLTSLLSMYAAPSMIHRDSMKFTPGEYGL